MLWLAVLSLSTQDNTNLFEKLKSGFKRTINWNKYQSKISTEKPNQYLDYLDDTSFQGINKPFVLSFDNNGHQTSYKQDYNLITDGQNFFDQPVRKAI